MQRILRINLLSRNQALKASRRKNLEAAKDDWKEFKNRAVANEKCKSEMIKAERKARREDWMAGPLAPRRDVGAGKDFFGTVKVALHQGPVYPPNARYGPKGNGWDPVGSEGAEGEQKEWEGLGNEGNIVEGDRVCIVQGKASLVGKIGTVKEVGKDTKEVKVEGLNLADVEIPPGVLQRPTTTFQTLELPIPLNDVRLVHRLTDPERGIDRDVVVKLLRGGGPYLQREQDSPLPRHTRYIAGLDIEVPWPHTDPPTYQPFDGDTSSYDVDQHTFTPSLWDPPIPNADIVNELRDDRFARDRRWHDDEYVRRKILEDVRATWYSERKLQSPLRRLGEEKIKEAAAEAERIKKAGMSLETRKALITQMRQKHKLGKLRNPQ